ncbi:MULTISPECIES: hypothetical protein [Cyanophyceae]|uniref:hypothetical protein n=1 Tax=Cyanophyceae TaxID=3028117 RepID=UPI0016879DA9|nr:MULTISPECIES: hypothetical protein [Cyanophyceae]MBD1914641.1 hypothetical protein [Phormidium sp. FACHB-77]MBD2030560.1 hypothetical protein [Phormidium sp. FACHB-322]MBD2052413.1 hypothetical protein [Leptolyngbya sp. FACHB-60]
MAKLSLKQKSWLISAHIAFAALWTGAVLSMFLISLRSTASNSGDALYALTSAINLLDDYIVIPAAVGSVITATALCWGANYGFTKFYWVITKWILTTGLVVFGTFWLFPWGNGAEQIASVEGLQAITNPTYAFEAKGVLIGTLVQAICLLTIIGISVLKPWGRRSPGKPPQEKALG